MNTPSSTAADAFEKALAYVTIVLTVMVLAALFKGRNEWAQIPPQIWVHIASLTVALVLTPVMLLRRRGDGLHRKLGWVWSVAMFVTAIDSLWVRVINPGHLSLIHLFSLLTIVAVPLLIWRARSHRAKEHRRAVRGLVTGGLLVAGFLTFPYDRLMGHWLFG